MESQFLKIILPHINSFKAITRCWLFVTARLPEWKHVLDFFHNYIWIEIPNSNSCVWHANTHRQVQMFFLFLPYVIEHNAISTNIRCISWKNRINKQIEWKELSTLWFAFYGWSQFVVWFDWTVGEKGICALKKSHRKQLWNFILWKYTGNFRQTLFNEIIFRSMTHYMANKNNIMYTNSQNKIAKLVIFLMIKSNHKH